MDMRPPLSPKRRRFLRGFFISSVAFGSLHFAPLSAKINRPGVVYWHGDSSQRKVALTFDDGPNEPYTSQILEILGREGVRATFFMVGENVEAFPSAARKVVQAGHAIGNHSYTHADLVFDTSRGVRNEILKTEDTIERVTGQRTHLFRPPYGYKDFLTLKQSRQLGYVMVQWSVTAQDWRKPGVEKIVKNVLSHVRPGAIVLLHDGDKWRHGGDRSQTVAALPLLIRDLRAQGYELVTLPEMLDVPPPEILTPKRPSHLQG